MDCDHLQGSSFCDMYKVLKRCCFDENPDQLCAKLLKTIHNLNVMFSVYVCTVRCQSCPLFLIHRVGYSQLLCRVSSSVDAMCQSFFIDSILLGFLENS